ncbi:MAG: hypothetical protein U9R79_14175 [Armatimonadota bacterium]|nr:hypothetical protein [Armatimonadota bacterium]
MAIDLDASFPRYEEHDPAGPVWCITPEVDRCFHRFFDTSPISPSGRYVGLTRLPAEDRMPRPGEPAEVVLVDLESGEWEVVAQTHGWDTQLGAQVQWGASDRDLFFIDMDVERWDPFGVKMDPFTGERYDLQGPLYMVSPDGGMAASPCLRRTRRTQHGYGVVAPDEAIPVNDGAPDDDGLYVTDTTTGQARLLVSFAQIVDMALDAEEYADGDFYGFHVKWSPQGDRLMFVVRWSPHGDERWAARRNNVITMRADGAEITCAIPAAQWGKGGHHPNWCPDGRRVMMNLKLDRETMRLVAARYDGSDLQTLNDEIEGSGHPAMHPDERHVITDEYAHGSLAWEDGTTPLRLLDIDSGEEVQVARIRTRPDFEGDQKVLRVDPHPAWGPDHRLVTFNACPTGGRDVFIADLSELL